MPVKGGMRVLNVLTPHVQVRTIAVAKVVCAEKSQYRRNCAIYGGEG